MAISQEKYTFRAGRSKNRYFYRKRIYTMASADPRVSAIRQQIETGDLGPAIEGLRALAQQYSETYLTAVSMQKSELLMIEREELELGNDTALRERRNRLKRQLLKLAGAIEERLPGPGGEAGGGSANAAHYDPPFGSARGQGPVNLMLLYAAADEAGMKELVKSMALLRHLKRVEVFGQHQVAHGQREKALQQALSDAEIVLPLISRQFVASAECLELQQQAYTRQQQQRLALIPILYAPTAHLEQLPIGQLQALPRNGQPITSWDSEDEAYAGISRELGQLVDTIRDQLDYTNDAIPAATQPPRPGQHEGFDYDTDALIQLFRDGKTERLIQELISVTERQPAFFKRALLLEQRWKALKEDRRNATAMPTELEVRHNKLNEELLGLLTEMD
jgi:hypothetical protein